MNEYKRFIYFTSVISFVFLNFITIIKVFDLIFTFTFAIVLSPTFLVPRFAFRVDGLGAYLGYDVCKIIVSYD
jgi:hypothetical protein